MNEEFPVGLYFGKMRHLTVFRSKEKRTEAIKGDLFQRILAVDTQQKNR